MNLSIKPLSVYFALAVAFKNAKAYDDAIASYMKQADVQKQTGSYAFYLVINSEKDFCSCYTTIVKICYYTISLIPHT